MDYIFLKMCKIQTEKHIQYIDSLNAIYDKVSVKMKKIINSQKYEEIFSCIFTQPIITSTYLAKNINISLSQAGKYLAVLEDEQILFGDDRSRGRKYYFFELLNLLEKNYI